MTASKGRLLQSGPAKVPSPSPRTQVPKTRLIQSRPLNNNADDDLNDVDDILNSDRLLENVFLILFFFYHL